MTSRLEIGGKVSQLKVSTSEVLVVFSRRFDIYMNDMKQGENNRVTKFGNYTKFCRTVKAERWQRILEESFSQHEKAGHWEIKFRVDKQKVILMKQMGF